ncbi:unnamed protein product, partial [Staurois parvus]
HSFGQSRGQNQCLEPQCVVVEAAAMGGHTATYDKMETSRSVRRPESGTWQSGSNGRRYRDPGHTVGPAAA